MSEKTLKQVGNEAAKHYFSMHTVQARNVDNSKDHVARADTKYWYLGNSSKTQEEAQEVSRKELAITEREYTEGIADSAEFAKANAEQLHDLAVLEAHIGGVAIKVEQPVEVGQKIEVHKN